MKLLLLLVFLLSYSSSFARNVVIDSNINDFNLSGTKIYAYSDTTYLGVNGTVGADGLLSLEVPDQEVRFRVDYAGQHYSPSSTSSNVAIDFIRPVTINSNVGSNNLAGKRVYVFQGSSYKSINKTFGNDGIATIYLPNDNYRYRVDYAGQTFTEETNSTNIQLDFLHEVTLDSNDGDFSLTNYRAYVFNGSQYQSLNAKFDAQGLVKFFLPKKEYRYRIDFVGQHFSQTTSAANVLINHTREVTVNATSDKDLLVNKKVYVFNESGQYQNVWTSFDQNGDAKFRLPDANFKYRVDFRGQWFTPVSNQTTVDASLSTFGFRNVLIDGSANKEELANKKVYVFDASNKYLNVWQNLDANGQASFYLANEDYKYRVDYQGQWFTSLSNSTTVDASLSSFGFRDVVVDFSQDKEKLLNAKVYVFDENDTYQDTWASIDVNGLAHFYLPTQNYKFRLDYKGQWFTPVSNSSLVVSSLNDFGFRDVLIDASIDSAHLVSKRVYVFDENEVYQSEWASFDQNGQASFYLPNRDYKFRVDFRGQWFTSVTNADVVNVSLASFGFRNVNVDGIINKDLIANHKVYVFSEEDIYENIYQTLDSNAQASFYLPNKSFKYRLDFRGQWFTQATNQSLVDISLATFGFRDVLIDGSADKESLVGKKVYVFDGNNQYIDVNKTFDANGQATFLLANQAYKYRIDFQGQYFTALSDATVIDASLFSFGFRDVVLSAGVDKDILENKRAYVFDENDQYLGLWTTFDDQGFATFNLADKNYKFRIDYIGQWFTPLSNQTAIDASLVSFGFRDVAINSNVGSNNLAGYRTYVFDENDVYVGLWENFDNQGIASFYLPNKNYKYRVDYTGQTFTPATNQTSVQLDFLHEVTLDSNDGDFNLAGYRSYVFDGDTYQNLNTTFDAQGFAKFFLPNKPYRYRIDYSGQHFTQTTSDDLVAVSLTREVTIDSNIGEYNLAGYRVYVYQGTVYKSLNATFDTSGLAKFQLPLGTYRYRVDYINQDYTQETDQNYIALTNYREVTIDSNQEDGFNLHNYRTYVFQGSTYKGLNAKFDSQGLAKFLLPDDEFRYRVDYVGQSYTPQTSNTLVTVDFLHNVAINSNVGENNLAGSRAYVFNENNQYQSVNKTFNTSGFAYFKLPNKEYKYRIDYAGQTFTPVTSSELVQLDFLHTVTLDSNNQGYNLHNARAYVYNGTSYQSINRTFNTSGYTQFFLPQKEYRYRVDYAGQNYTATTSSNYIHLDNYREVVVDSNTDTGNLANTNVLVYKDTQYLSILKKFSSIDGLAKFYLPEDSFRYRVDFDGQQFSQMTSSVYVKFDKDSSDFTYQNKELFQTYVQINSNFPKNSQLVKVYDENGIDLNLSSLTDAEGLAIFSLEEGNYKFIYNFGDRNFESNIVSQTQTAQISIPDPITISFRDGVAPIVDTTINAYTFDGTNLNYNVTTNNQGVAQLFVDQPGQYKFEITYNGQTKFTPVYNLPISYDYDFSDLELISLNPTFLSTGITTIETNTQISIPIVWQGPLTKNAELNFSVLGSATTSLDYSILSDSSIHAIRGQTSSLILIAIHEDIIYEHNEKIEINLSISGGQGNQISSFTITILNDEIPPLLLPLISEMNILEVDLETEVIYSLSHPSEIPLSYAFSLDSYQATESLSLSESVVSLSSLQVTTSIDLMFTKDGKILPDSTYVIYDSLNSSSSETATLSVSLTINVSDSDGIKLSGNILVDSVNYGERTTLIFYSLSTSDTFIYEEESSFDLILPVNKAPYALSARSKDENNVKYHYVKKIITSDDQFDINFVSQNKNIFLVEDISEDPLVATTALLVNSFGQVVETSIYIDGMVNFESYVGVASFALMENDSLIMSHPMTFPLETSKFTIGEPIEVKVSQANTPVSSISFQYWNNLYPLFKQNIETDENGVGHIAGFYEYYYNFSLIGQTEVYRELVPGDRVSIDLIVPSTSTTVIVSSADNFNSYPVDEVHLYSPNYLYAGQSFKLSDDHKVDIPNLTGAFRVMIEINGIQLYSGIKTLPMDTIKISLANMIKVQLISPFGPMREEEVSITDFKDTFLNPYARVNNSPLYWQLKESDENGQILFPTMYGHNSLITWQDQVSQQLRSGDQVEFFSHVKFYDTNEILEAQSSLGIESNLFKVIIENNTGEEINVSRLKSRSPNGIATGQCSGPSIEYEFVCNVDSTVSSFEGIINGTRFVSQSHTIVGTAIIISIDRPIKVTINPSYSKTGSIEYEIANLPPNLSPQFRVTANFDGVSQLKYYTESDVTYKLKVNYAERLYNVSYETPGNIVDLTNRPPGYRFNETYSKMDSYTWIPTTVIDYSQRLPKRGQWGSVVVINGTNQLQVHDACLKGVYTKNCVSVSDLRPSTDIQYEAVFVPETNLEKFQVLAKRESSGVFDLYIWDNVNKRLLAEYPNFFHSESGDITVGSVGSNTMAISYIDPIDSKNKINMYFNQVFQKSLVIANYPVKSVAFNGTQEVFHIDPLSQNIVGSRLWKDQRVDQYALGFKANPAKNLFATYNFIQKSNIVTLLFSDLDNYDRLSLVQYDTENKKIVTYLKNLSSGPVQEYGMNGGPSIEVSYIDPLQRDRVQVFTFDTTNINIFRVHNSLEIKNLIELKYPAANNLIGRDKNGLLHWRGMPVSGSSSPFLEANGPLKPGTKLKIHEDGDYNYHDLDNNPFSLSYQWQSSFDGVVFGDILNEIEKEYTIRNDDSSKFIRCIIKAQGDENFQDLESEVFKVEDPTLSLKVKANEVDENDGGSGLFELSLDHPTNHPLQIIFSVPVSSTSVFITSYVVNLPVGSSNARVPLRIIDNAVDDNDFIVAVQLMSNIKNVVIAAPFQQIKILDDEPDYNLSFGQKSYFIDEGTSSEDIDFSWSGPSSKIANCKLISNPVFTSLDFDQDFNLNRDKNKNSFNIGVLEDSVYQTSRTTDIQVVCFNNSTLENYSSSITIRDNDIKPTISLNTAFQQTNEGGAAKLGFSLSHLSSLPITLKYYEVGHTNNDLLNLDDSFEIPPYTIQFEYDLYTKEDNIYEGTGETKTVRFYSTDHAINSTSMSLELFIQDNDPVPTIQFNTDQTIVTEGQKANIVLSLSNPSGVPLPFTLETVNGSADQLDYSFVEHDFNFPINLINYTFELNTIDDEIDEFDESLNILIKNGQAIFDQHQLVIADNDGTFVSLTVDATEITENGTILNGTVTLNGLSALNVAIDISITGDDLMLLSSSVSTLYFPPGVTEQSFMIEAGDNQIYQGIQINKVNLSNPLNTDIGVESSVDVKILDDENKPTIQFIEATRSIFENEHNSVLELSIQPPSHKEITVKLEMETSERISIPDQITIASNQNIKNIELTLQDNEIYDSTSIHKITILSSSKFLSPESNTMTLHLMDNESKPQLLVATNEINLEGESDVFPLHFNQTDLSSNSTNINVSPSENCSHRFDSAIYNLSIKSGQLTTFLNVAVKDDNVWEQFPSCSLAIMSTSDIELQESHTNVNVVIEDSDSKPKLVLPELVRLNEEQESIEFQLQLSNLLANSSSFDVIIDPYSEYNVTAQSDTLTFDRFENEAKLKISVQKDDIFRMNNEIPITIKCTNPESIENCDVTLKLIVKQDETPTLSMLKSSTQMTENTTLTYIPVSLSTPMDVPVSFSVSMDVFPSSTSVFTTTEVYSFAPFTTVTDIVVYSIDNKITEQDKTINLKIASNLYPVDKNSHTVYLRDDDEIIDKFAKKFKFYDSIPLGKHSFINDKVSPDSLLIANGKAYVGLAEKGNDGRLVVHEVDLQKNEVVQSISDLTQNSLKGGVDLSIAKGAIFATLRDEQATITFGYNDEDKIDPIAFDANYEQAAEGSPSSESDGDYQYILDQDDTIGSALVLKIVRSGEVLAQETLSDPTNIFDLKLRDSNILHAIYKDYSADDKLTYKTFTKSISNNLPKLTPLQTKTALSHKAIGQEFGVTFINNDLYFAYQPQDDPLKILISKLDSQNSLVYNHSISLDAPYSNIVIESIKEHVIVGITNENGNVAIYKIDQTQFQISPFKDYTFLPMGHYLLDDLEYDEYTYDNLEKENEISIIKAIKSSGNEVQVLVAEADDVYLLKIGLGIVVSPKIIGPAKINIGDTLVLSNLDFISNTVPQFDFSWFKSPDKLNWTEIQGMADSIYTVNQLDLGMYIKAKVKVNNDDNNVFEDILYIAPNASLNTTQDKISFTEDADQNPKFQFEIALDQVTNIDTTITATITGDSTEDVDYEIRQSNQKLEIITLPDGNKAFTVVIPATQSAISLTLDVLDDLELENTESLNLTLVGSPYYNIGAHHKLDIRIKDNEPNEDPVLHDYFNIDYYPKDYGKKSQGYERKFVTTSNDKIMVGARFISGFSSDYVTLDFFDLQTEKYLKNIILTGVLRYSGGRRNYIRDIEMVTIEDRVYIAVSFQFYEGSTKYCYTKLLEVDLATKNISRHVHLSDKWHSQNYALNLNVIDSNILLSMDMWEQGQQKRKSYLYGENLVLVRSNTSQAFKSDLLHLNQVIDIEGKQTAVFTNRGNLLLADFNQSNLTFDNYRSLHLPAYISSSHKLKLHGLDANILFIYRSGTDAYFVNLEKLILSQNTITIDQYKYQKLSRTYIDPSLIITDDNIYTLTKQYLKKSSWRSRSYRYRLVLEKYKLSELVTLDTLTNPRYISRIKTYHYPRSYNWSYGVSATDQKVHFLESSNRESTLYRTLSLGEETEIELNVEPNAIDNALVMGYVNVGTYISHDKFTVVDTVKRHWYVKMVRFWEYSDDLLSWYTISSSSRSYDSNNLWIPKSLSGKFLRLRTTLDDGYKVTSKYSQLLEVRDVPEIGFKTSASSTSQGDAYKIEIVSSRPVSKDTMVYMYQFYRRGYKRFEAKILAGQSRTYLSFTSDKIGSYYLRMDYSGTFSGGKTPLYEKYINTTHSIDVRAEVDSMVKFGLDKQTSTSTMSHLNGIDTSFENAVLSNSKGDCLVSNTEINSQNILQFTLVDSSEAFDLVAGLNLKLVAFTEIDFSKSPQLFRSSNLREFLILYKDENNDLKLVQFSYIAEQNSSYVVKDDGRLISQSVDDAIFRVHNQNLYILTNNITKDLTLFEYDLIYHEIANQSTIQSNYNLVKNSTQSYLWTMGSLQETLVLAYQNSQNSITILNVDLNLFSVKTSKEILFNNSNFRADKIVSIDDSFYIVGTEQDVSNTRLMYYNLDKSTYALDKSTMDFVNDTAVKADMNMFENQGDLYYGYTTLDSNQRKDFNLIGFNDKGIFSSETVALLAESVFNKVQSSINSGKLRLLVVNTLSKSVEQISLGIRPYLPNITVPNVYKPLTFNQNIEITTDNVQNVLSLDLGLSDLILIDKVNQDDLLILKDKSNLEVIDKEIALNNSTNVKTFGKSGDKIYLIENGNTTFLSEILTETPLSLNTITQFSLNVSNHLIDTKVLRERAYTIYLSTDQQLKILNTSLAVPSDSRQNSLDISHNGVIEKMKVFISEDNIILSILVNSNDSKQIYIYTIDSYDFSPTAKLIKSIPVVEGSTEASFHVNGSIMLVSQKTPLHTANLIFSLLTHATATEFKLPLGKTQDGSIQLDEDHIYFCAIQNNRARVIDYNWLQNTYSTITRDTKAVDVHNFYSAIKPQSNDCWLSVDNQKIDMFTGDGTHLSHSWSSKHPYIQAYYFDDDILATFQGENVNLSIYISYLNSIYSVYDGSSDKGYQLPIYWQNKLSSGEFSLSFHSSDDSYIKHTGEQTTLLKPKVMIQLDNVQVVEGNTIEAQLVLDVPNKYDSQIEISDSLGLFETQLVSIPKDKKYVGVELNSIDDVTFDTIRTTKLIFRSQDNIDLSNAKADIQVSDNESKPTISAKLPVHSGLMHLVEGEAVDNVLFEDLSITFELLNPSGELIQSTVDTSLDYRIISSGDDQELIRDVEYKSNLTWSGKITIPAGQSSTILPLHLIDDNLYEGNKDGTLQLDFFNPINATIGTGFENDKTISIFVSDNESKPKVEFLQSAQTVLESNSSYDIVLKSDLASKFVYPIGFTYSNIDNTADENDFRINTTNPQNTILFQPFNLYSAIHVNLFSDDVQDVNQLENVDFKILPSINNSYLVVQPSAFKLNIKDAQTVETLLQAAGEISTYSCDTHKSHLGAPIVLGVNYGCTGNELFCSTNDVSQFLDVDVDIFVQGSKLNKAECLVTTELPHFETVCIAREPKLSEGQVTVKVSGTEAGSFIGSKTFNLDIEQAPQIEVKFLTGPIYPVTANTPSLIDVEFSNPFSTPIRVFFKTSGSLSVVNGDSPNYFEVAPGIETKSIQLAVGSNPAIVGELAYLEFYQVTYQKQSFTGIAKDTNPCELAAGLTLPTWHTYAIDAKASFKFNVNPSTVNFTIDLEYPLYQPFAAEIVASPYIIGKTLSEYVNGNGNISSNELTIVNQGGDVADRASLEIDYSAKYYFYYVLKNPIGLNRYFELGVRESTGKSKQYERFITPSFKKVILLSDNRSLEDVSLKIDRGVDGDEVLSLLRNYNYQFVQVNAEEVITISIEETETNDVVTIVTLQADVNELTVNLDETIQDEANGVTTSFVDLYYKDFEESERYLLVPQSATIINPRAIGEGYYRSPTADTVQEVQNSDEHKKHSNILHASNFITYVRPTAKCASLLDGTEGNTCKLTVAVTQDEAEHSSKTYDGGFDNQGDIKFSIENNLIKVDWNGRIEGKLVPPGTYNISINLTDKHIVTDGANNEFLITHVYSLHKPTFNGSSYNSSPTPLSNITVHVAY